VSPAAHRDAVGPVHARQTPGSWCPAFGYPTAFGPRAALWLGLCAVLLGACVDTAPGLVVEAREGSVVVAADDALSVDLRLDVRVGRYALDGRSFITPRVDLFVAGEGVARVNLDRPVDFTGELAPGQSRELVLRGTSPAMAWPRVRELCGAEVTLVVQWQAETAPANPADPAIMEFGSVSVVTTDVRCE